MPSSKASLNGSNAERSAARKYDLEGADEQTGYYDLFASNGTHYQVKSTSHTRASGNPGKFRFWKDHLFKLHKEQSAVILVLFSSTNRRVLKIEKVSTSEIVDLVNGRWYPSEHADGMGEQYKIPWPDLLTLTG